MKERRVRQLLVLTDLIRDRSLENLRRAAAERDLTRAHIAGLEAPPASDLPALAAAQVALSYQRWADERRRELNMQLARQMVSVAQRQAEARLAFGRAEVLHRLATPGRR